MDTEENGANGHDETVSKEEKPNAFDKIQADENDEGTTGAKVRLHDVHCPLFVANALRYRPRPMTATQQRNLRTTPTVPPNPPLPKKPSKKTKPAKKRSPPTSSKKA